MASGFLRAQGIARGRAIARVPSPSRPTARFVGALGEGAEQTCCTIRGCPRRNGWWVGLSLDGLVETDKTCCPAATHESRNRPARLVENWERRDFVLSPMHDSRRAELLDGSWVPLAVMADAFGSLWIGDAGGQDLLSGSERPRRADLLHDSWVPLAVMFDGLGLCSLLLETDKT